MATVRPIQGTDLKLNKRKIIEIITSEIEIILLLFNFSSKKTNPNKTLKIGKI